MSQVGLTMTQGHESPKPPGRKRSKLAVLIAFLIVLCVVVAAGFVAYKEFFSTAPDYPGPGVGSVNIQVKQGDSIPAIGQTLQDKKVVLSADAFVDAASDDSRARSIQAGFYKMKQQMSGAGALGILTDMTNRISSLVVVPEGSRASEVVVAASKGTGIPEAEFVAVIKNPKGLGLPTWAKNRVEGFLFPATYDFGPDATATSVLKAMVTKFKQVAASIDLEARAAALKKTPYEIVTIASIVEAEVYEEDFPKGARVIYNRLAINKPLEMDSTANYGLGSTDIDLTAEQLRTQTPYNTHGANRGLTPTPIGNPGEAALKASLEPADGNWIYFLTIPGTKETRFTDDYKLFLEYQKDLRADLDKQN